MIDKAFGLGVFGLTVCLAATGCGGSDPAPAATTTPTTTSPIADNSAGGETSSTAPPSAVTPPSNGPANPPIALSTTVTAGMQTGHGQPISATPGTAGTGPAEGNGNVVAQPQMPVVSGGSQGGPLTTGQPRQDALGTGDATAGDMWVDQYTIDLTQGQMLDVVMRSDVFDTLLRVTDPNGAMVAENDDDPSGAYGTYAHVSFRAPSAGTYRVLATSYGPQMSGAYTIEPTTRSGAVAFNRDHRGTLEASDHMHPQANTFYDAYPVQLDAGATIEVSMESADFDTLVRLVDAQGNEVAFNDDASGQAHPTDSMLVATVPAAGRYQLYANSFEPGMRGAYTMHVVAYR